MSHWSARIIDQHHLLEQEGLQIVRVGDAGNAAVVRRVEFEQIESGVQLDPIEHCAVAMHPTEMRELLQALVDMAWARGIRPSRGDDSARTVHIEDLRKMNHRLLDILQRSVAAGFPPHPPEILR